MLIAQHSEEQVKLKGDLLLHRKQIESMTMQNKEVQNNHIQTFHLCSTCHRLSHNSRHLLKPISRACAFQIHRKGWIEETSQQRWIFMLMVFKSESLYLQMQAEHERRMKDIEIQLRGAETAIIEWIQQQFSALQAALSFHATVPAIE